MFKYALRATVPILRPIFALNFELKFDTVDILFESIQTSLTLFLMKG